MRATHCDFRVDGLFGFDEAVWHPEVSDGGHNDGYVVTGRFQV
jgi:hypothetical protein